MRAILTSGLAIAHRDRDCSEHPKRNAQFDEDSIRVDYVRLGLGPSYERVCGAPGDQASLKNCQALADVPGKNCYHCAWGSLEMDTNDLTAYQQQHDAIREVFKKQAANWGQDGISPHLQWAVECLGLQPQFAVLDVAAGTGLLSRAISPSVKSVVALDITPEMLAQGRSEADRDGFTNISFEQGSAEDLPYPSRSFDLVATRFSVHHFQSPDVVLREMVRVCRDGGRLAVIDIVASEDRQLAARYNQMERLRDFSHTEALSPSGLKKMIVDAGVRLTNYYAREVENSLDDWLDFARTEADTREQIIKLMQRELAGLEETGMRPFLEDRKLMFMHTWGIVLGEKR